MVVIEGGGGGGGGVCCSGACDEEDEGCPRGGTRVMLVEKTPDRRAVGAPERGAVADVDEEALDCPASSGVVEKARWASSPVRST